MITFTRCAYMAKQACATFSQVVQKITPPIANNSLKFFFALFATLTLNAATAWGADVTVKWTASSGALGSNIGSGTIKTGTFSWDYTRTLKSGSTYTGWLSNCIQLGKNGGVENITFTTSAIPGTIKNVSIECASYQGKHNVAITVGGKSYLSSTATSSWTTVSAISASGTSSGTIQISLTGGTRALYIKSISVTYEEAAATVPVTGVSLNKSTLTLTEGDSETLTATVAPANATDKTVTWSTSNANFAIVSNGKVTAVAEGSATITVKTKDGNKTATCNVTVNPKPKYTVTLVPGSGSVSSTTLTEASAGAGVTLPTPTLDCGDWEFAGWTNSSVATETTTKPTLIPAGAYNPASNITLYAVYQRTETIQGGGNGNYELITSTSAPDDWSGTYLIVDGTSKNCFNGNLTTLDADGNYKSVTISDNTITSNTTTDSYSVTISKSTTNGKYYIKTASGYYIGSSASTSSDANELKSSTSTKYDNSISINSTNVTIKGPDHILKFFHQTNANWRFRYYKSTTTQNVRLPQLYKKSSGSSTTTYYHSTPDCADPCDALQAPNVRATATANSITLSWAAVSGATSYNIYNYTTEETDETTNLTYTFNGLDSETEYEWEVEAVSATCNGKGSKGTTTTQKTCTDAVNVIKGIPSNGSFNLDKTEKQSTCNGAVTVTLSDIQPAAGYKFSEITQSGINTGVTIDNNNQKVTYAQNTIGNSTINVTFTELPKYTVSFSTGTSNPTQADVIESVGGQGITLPVGPDPLCPDWTFAGWATSSVDKTTTEPTLLKANDKYQPTSDITLYAVYSTTAETTGFTGYEKVTEEPEDWSGKYLLSTGTYTATGAFDDTGTKGHLVRATYTPGIDEKTEWEFTLAKVDNTRYSILFPDGSSYLGYASSTNFARSAAVVSSEKVAYLWTPSTSGITNVSATSRKIADNGSADFRPYSSPSSGIVYLYKRIGGGAITTYNSNPDCTPPAEYTITWWANGEEYHSQTAVEGTAIDVPTTSPDAAVYACDDKVFVGWVDAEIIGSTNTEPTFITDFDKITENKDYFAVFATRSSSEPTAYTAGDVGNFVLAAKNGDKWYALPTNPTVNSGKIQGKEIPVTTTDGVEHVTTTNALGYTWTIANAANGQTISDGSKYIYHKNGGESDTDLSYGIGTSYTWKIEKESAGLTFQAMNGATINKRGMLVQGTQFGGYALSNETTDGYYRISVLPIADAVSYSGYVTTCEKPTYTRVVKPGEYGTICLPYGSSDYTGAEFYEVSSVEYGKGLWLDQLAAGTALAAGKPYIFRATAEKLAVVYKGEKKDSPVDGVNGLTGTFTAIAANSTLVGHFIIAKNQIWVANDKNTLPAYRAYINADVVPTTAQVQLPGRRRVCMGENAATGFENVTNGENTTIKVIENGQLIIIRNGEKYNIQGQKL